MIKLKSLIKEYVTNPIIDLAKYLKQSDLEKATDLAFHIPYKVFEWAELKGIDIPKTDDPFDTIDYADSLYNDNRKLFNEYAMWLYKEFIDGDIEGEQPGYPSWNYFSFDNYIKNQWLIHFSDNATDIWRSQKFEYGVDDYTTLGLTHNISKSSKAGGGYNFAYLLSDYKRYGKDIHGFGSGWKYGQEAVVFKASGVKVWHYGDEEPQVIFWGETAKDIVLLEYNKNDGEWMISTSTSNTIYKSEKIGNVVDWITNNFDQYKKVLLPHKKYYE